MHCDYLSLSLSLSPPDPSDWAAKAAQWAQQRQIQEQYFQQLTQWQQQMAPQEQAPPPEQVPSLGQPIQPFISSAQPQLQPQAIFQQQQQQHVMQAQPATLNMNAPHHQVEPQQAPSSHHTQPVVHQQEEEPKGFDHLPGGEKFQREPPQQQQEFHPRGNFGHRPTFQPRGGGEFHFRGPHGDDPPRPRAQHVFESHERAPSPHHWEKAERPPRVGSKRDFGAAHRSDKRHPLPPTEEMFRGKHGIKGFHPMKEFQSGGSPMHGFEKLEGDGDDEFGEHGEYQTMEGYRDGRMKSRWENEEQDEQYEEQDEQYEEQEEQYEEQSGGYEEQHRQYEQRGVRYEERSERYEQQGEQYEERSERYEQQGERYGERYEQQGERYPHHGERYEQQGEQYKHHGERYKEQREQYVRQEGQYGERKGEDGYRNKPELGQLKQEDSQHDTEGEWLYGHQEQGHQRGSDTHFDRSRGKHLYQDEPQYQRNQTGRAMPTNYQDEPQYQRRGFGRDQEPFVRQEIKQEPSEGLQFGRTSVKGEATLSSLRKDTAFIPGLGGFEKEETASPMAPHAQTGTKEAKAASQTLSNNPTNQMIESLGKIVSQLQTLQGLTSSLQLLQALPKGQQEAVKAAAERMRETDGGGGGGGGRGGGGGQQTERELSEETKRKVAALLASESDSDGEQVYTYLCTSACT